MLILLSPAKTLDFTPSERDLPTSMPVLHSDAKKLASVAKELSVEEVAELMGLSDKLAQTAHGYLQTWKAKADAKGAKQAALAFRGDVYQGLHADSLTDKQLEKSQQHLRILSGLYGVLRPLDLIQPYRLEMGRKLANPRGKDLYAWWGERVTAAMNVDLADATPRGKQPTVINLASNEYVAVVNKKRLQAEIITPAFKDFKNGKYKIISFYAKRARGLMARWLLKTGGKKPLQEFSAEGYVYNVQLSSEQTPVFTREQPESSTD